MTALDRYLASRERRVEIAQDVVNALRDELGMPQQELPWGLEPEDRPLSFDEAVEAGAIKP